MSDERDRAGSASDGTDIDDTGDGQTAVVTRPPRPTGKRSRRAAVDADAGDTDTALDTEAKVTKNGSGGAKKTTKKDPDSPSRNPIAYVWTFLQQVVAELRKVIWPNRKQMVSYTIVVLIFLAFMVALIGLVDLGLVKLVSMFLG